MPCPPPVVLAALAAPPLSRRWFWPVGHPVEQQLPGLRTGAQWPLRRPGAGGLTAMVWERTPRRLVWGVLSNAKIIVWESLTLAATGRVTTVQVEQQWSFSLAALAWRAAHRARFRAIRRQAAKIMNP